MDMIQAWVRGSCLPIWSDPDTGESGPFILDPEDDESNDLTVAIFPSDVTLHGSSVWNTENVTVAHQVERFYEKYFIDDGDQPGRVSITIPISYITNNPRELWKSIQRKLGALP